jgi:hypothetical protein
MIKIVKLLNQQKTKECTIARACWNKTKCDLSMQKLEILKKLLIKKQDRLCRQLTNEANHCRKTFIIGDKSFINDVTVDVAAPVSKVQRNKHWWIVFSIALTALYVCTYTVTTGTGTWGLNKTAGWA